MLSEKQGNNIRSVEEEQKRTLSLRIIYFTWAYPVTEKARTFCKKFKQNSWGLVISFC